MPHWTCSVSSHHQDEAVVTWPMMASSPLVTMQQHHGNHSTSMSPSKESWWRSYWPAPTPRPTGQSSSLPPCWIGNHAAMNINLMPWMAGSWQANLQKWKVKGRKERSVSNRCRVYVIPRMVLLTPKAVQTRQRSVEHLGSSIQKFGHSRKSICQARQPMSCPCPTHAAANRVRFVTFLTMVNIALISLLLNWSPTCLIREPRGSHTSTPSSRICRRESIRSYAGNLAPSAKKLLWTSSYR